MREHRMARPLRSRCLFTSNRVAAYRVAATAYISLSRTLRCPARARPALSCPRPRCPVRASSASAFSFLSLLLFTFTLFLFCLCSVRSSPSLSCARPRCPVCASSASASFSPSFSSSISPSLYAGMFVCSFRRIISGISVVHCAGCHPFLRFFFSYFPLSSFSSARHLRWRAFSLLLLWARGIGGLSGFYLFLLHIVLCPRVPRAGCYRFSPSWSCACHLRWRVSFAFTCGASLP